MNNHYTAADSLAYKRRRYTAKLHPEVVQDLYERVNNGMDVNLAMLIADVLGPGEWRKQAACRDADPDWFFPQRASKDVAKARKLCASCPVQEQCFEYAQDAPEEQGIWAGHSATNRRRQYINGSGKLARSKYNKPTLVCVDCFCELDRDDHVGSPACDDCRHKRRLQTHANTAARSGGQTYWAAS